MTTIERRLATVETITAIRPIPGADAIEVARVRGWDVVVRRDEFAVGDAIIYVEVDAFLPTADERFAFLAPRGERVFDGVTGHVVKTAKLRGQISQGIIFPLSILDTPAEVGDDVTDQLGIVKYDPPLPASLAGVARGPLPAFVHRTDEERIQNADWLLSASPMYGWVATEKIDGTSTSFYLTADGDAGVCSRNLDLIDTPSSAQWQMARQLDIHTKLADLFAGHNAAVQGELFGPGIQGNPLGVDTVQFRAFTLLFDDYEVPRIYWPAWLVDIAVPVHELPVPTSIEEAIAQADAARSLVTPGKPIEGLVWRSSVLEKFTVSDDVTVRASVKVISSKCLLKHDR